MTDALVEHSAQDRLFGDPTGPLPTSREALAQIAKDARIAYQQGGKITPQQWKALREEAFYELQAVVWADRRALADEVKTICGMTYNALDKAKCPWNAHGPTEKAPIFRWLAVRLAGELAAKVRKAGETRADEKRDREREDAKTRRLKAQADREESAAAHDRERFQTEAEDHARALITAVCSQLRLILIDEMPATIAAGVHGKDRAAAESEVRALLESALGRAATAATP